MLRSKTRAGIAVLMCVSGGVLMGATSWEEPEETEPLRLPEVVVAPSPEALAERARRAHLYAAAEHNGIEPALAERIQRAAREEGIDPRLAFALVHVESRFDPEAVGPAGAIGLAQVMDATARWIDPQVESEDLTDPETNVRLGMRYLRGLIDRYDGDHRMALTAYNRGPTTVARARAAGEAPYNGYARRVLQSRVPCTAAPGWCGEAAER